MDCRGSLKLVGQPAEVTLILCDDAARFGGRIDELFAVGHSIATYFMRTDNI